MRACFANSGAQTSGSTQQTQHREPDARAAELAQWHGWDSREQACVAALWRELGADAPADSQILQVAWSRKLDAAGAAELWRQHIRVVEEMHIDDVSDAQVRCAYDQGFCVRAGRDHAGRPIIWVRLAKCNVSKLTPPLAVRNSWLAQDAALSIDNVANREGLCFVYDLRDIGLQNMTFNPLYLKAAIVGATSHPMHLTRVWLMDAPDIFWSAWRIGQHFLPTEVRDVVRFCKTGARDSHDCFSQI